jgi:hypothetical protein
MGPTRGLVFVLCAASLATLVGCGPVYRTQYSFVPPVESEGRRCIVQCADIQARCREAAENRASLERSACQQNATIRYAACLATAKDDSTRRACSYAAYCDVRADTAHCDDDEYARCCATCGGHVESRQVCVSGC